jgi:hypothetical protein
MRCDGCFAVPVQTDVRFRFHSNDPAASCRACPGYPRLQPKWTHDAVVVAMLGANRMHERKTWMAGTKPGHDEKGGGASGIKPPCTAATIA